MRSAAGCERRNRILRVMSRRNPVTFACVPIGCRGAVVCKLRRYQSQRMFRALKQKLPAAKPQTTTRPVYVKP